MTGPAITALFALLLLAPDVARACSVCFSGTDETRLMFLLTTGLLTFLPLALIGGLVFYVRRRMVEAERALEPHTAPRGAEGLPPRP
jgi:hypothetical protein